MQRKSKRLLVVMICGAIIVSLGLIGLTGPLRWAYAHTLMPVGAVMSHWGGSAHEALVELSAIGRLQADNKQLETENASLRQRLASNAELARQNDILRQQLGLNLAATRRQVAAEVVSYQPDSYRQFVTISRGKTEGIQVGQAVTSGGVLIGVISSVDSSTSEVLLVTDPVFKLIGRDQSTGATGIVQGQLGTGLVMSEIGQTDTVKPADTVVTSGVGGQVPEGIIIGQIQSVQPELQGIFQTAEVATTLKPSQLVIVFVVVGP